MKQNGNTRFINQWPSSPCDLGGWSLLSVISLLLCLLVLVSIFCCSAHSPLPLLEIIQALFELQDASVFSFSLSLACSNRGCCISQRNVQFLPPPRRWLSLLLKEWGQISQADQRERSSISYLHMYIVSDDEDSPFGWSCSTNLLVVYFHK